MGLFNIYFENRKKSLICYYSYMRKLLMTQFNYMTCKNYRSEEIKHGEDITFERFVEKLELIKGIAIINMTR